MVDHIKFTTSKLDKLRIPEKGITEFTDTEQPKLRIRVNAGGTKTFFLQKKIGTKTRHTIGVYPDIQPHRARELAIAMLDEINQGIDPTIEKQAKVKSLTTLQTVLDNYLDTHPSLKPTTHKNYRYRVKKYFQDWANKPIANITKDMVAERHHFITNNNGARTANNGSIVLKALCSYAEANEIISSSPTSILKTARLMHKNKVRNRIISTDELPRWYKAVSELKNRKASIYLLTLLYTGFRLTETIELKWAHVDMKYKNFILLDTKNSTDKSFPMSGDLHRYFVELNKLTGHSEWVFPNDTNTGHMSRPRDPLASLDKTLGFHITPHDVRRTFTTLSEAVGNQESLTRRLTNHTKGNDITNQYIQAENDTLRKASEKIANGIQQALGRTAEVLPFHQHG